MDRKIFNFYLIILVLEFILIGPIRSTPILQIRPPTTSTLATILSSASPKSIDGFGIDPKIWTKFLPHLRARIDKIEPRSGLSRITAFVTDPALLVTILHSLEVAYWTMPLGFLLNPLINLFRIPNRRMDLNSQSINSKTLLNIIKRIEERQKKINPEKYRFDLEHSQLSRQHQH
ncbi:hypothetical protein SSS_08334 [Sarcoptes scabiei]|uniref:Uncharacterized protein n=1 Tax=Sarcoptes scabiei TaxID=52283 RepID=A0A834R8K0_SARSC|nr:hypothetical protein SSS_08334 [Sarcoptes scabiei]